MAQQENQWQQALAAIDASSIDALNAIKKDHDILDERLKALDGVKQEFADAVYNRVRGDYEKRRAALDEQAAPLKDAARAQYAKLRELTQRIETDHEAIKLDQQELELRRKLGEFDEKEFKRRLGEIEGTIKERTQAHEQASALKKRFLEPFSDESELTAMQDEAAAAAAQISVPGTTQRQTLAGADLAAIANTLAEMRTNEVAAVLSDAPPNKTQVMSAINLPEPALAAAGAPAGGATQVFRAARDFVADALQGDVLSCDHTHRNSPQLLAIVNEVMGEAQREGGYEGGRANLWSWVPAPFTEDVEDRITDAVGRLVKKVTQ